MDRTVKSNNYSLKNHLLLLTNLSELDYAIYGTSVTHSNT